MQIQLEGVFMKKYHILSLFSVPFLLVPCTNLVDVSAKTTTYNFFPTDNGPIDTSYSGTVTTVGDRPFLTLYAFNDNRFSLIRNRALAPKTAWFYDQTVSRNGEIYYRVATNEWIKYDEIEGFSGHHNRKHFEKKTVTLRVRPVLPAPVFDGNFNDTGKTLAVGSEWIAFEKPVYFGGNAYYQIGKDEFVAGERVINLH